MEHIILRHKSRHFYSKTDRFYTNFIEIRQLIEEGHTVKIFNKKDRVSPVAEDITKITLIRMFAKFAEKNITLTEVIDLIKNYVPAE